MFTSNLKISLSKSFICQILKIHKTTCRWVRDVGVSQTFNSDMMSVAVGIFKRRFDR